MNKLVASVFACALLAVAFAADDAEVNAKVAEVLGADAAEDAKARLAEVIRNFQDGEIAAAQAAAEKLKPEERAALGKSDE